MSKVMSGAGIAWVLRLNRRIAIKNGYQLPGIEAAFSKRRRSAMNTVHRIRRDAFHRRRRYGLLRTPETDHTNNQFGWACSTYG